MNRILSLGLMLGCVLCVSTLAGDDTRARSQVAIASPSARQSPSLSPSPTPQSSSKRPNAVRRFFSWTLDQVTWPVRKQPQIGCLLPPSISSITTSKSVITFCPTAATTSSNLVCSPEREVKLVANATDDEAQFRFSWTVTGGSIRGEGREATWDLSGLAEGTYTATVEFNDGYQHTATGSTTVTIALCSGCDAPPPPPCPTISVSCPDDLASKSITFEAIVKGGDPEMKATYSWSITGGRIVSGQGTSKLTVDISDLGGRSMTATVSLGGGADPACTITQASCSISH